jgi:hypothetical protein
MVFAAPLRTESPFRSSTTFFHQVSVVGAFPDTPEFRVAAAIERSANIV